jgi:thymidylate kinase
VRHVGKLYVFEGPDGVGKSELSRRFTAMLEQQGTLVKLLSFPCWKEANLGRLVYDFHHAPKAFGVARVSPSSLQLMHIAAHVDTIEAVIRPALRQGISVVLDRFWWSTKVYGIASGSEKRVLQNMIDVELCAWGQIRPSAVFLITRKTPLRPEPEGHWARWRDLYLRVAAEEQQKARVIVIENDSSIDAARRQLTLALAGIERQKFTKGGAQLPLDLSAKMSSPASRQLIFSALAPAKLTVVYDTYWRFAAERQEIFFRRWRGQALPWTTDRILAEFKFTNAYRASDRVSQYLIKEVIYKGDTSEEEIFFRTILFKLFNKIETWELLQKCFGAVTYNEFDFKAYDNVLSKASEDRSIYSGAYIMPSGNSAFGTTRKHRAHLKLLTQMMDDEVALRIAEAKTMPDVFTLLRSYPMIGDFLAYQYAIDLNYSSLTNFSEMEFVVPGPGAKGGISKCFESSGGLSEADLIRVVTERQDREFERLGLDFKSLWGRPLQLIDCQNLFCEVDKYSRVHHPEISGSSERTRIKQKFKPTLAAIEYWYPPKWGINEKIAKAVKEPGNENSRVSA